MATLNTRISLKRDLATAWESNNPVLLIGELGYDSTHKYIKIGDGTTAWNALDEIHIDIDNVDRLDTIDTNTTYQLVTEDSLTYKLQSKEKNGSSWTDVASFTLPDLTTLNFSKLDAAQGKIITGLEQKDGLLSATVRDVVSADIPLLPTSTVDGLPAELTAIKSDIADLAPYQEGQTPVGGDVVVCTSGDSADKEFVWAQACWHEFGKEGVYATKAELEAAIDRIAANEGNISKRSNEVIPALDGRLSDVEELADANAAGISTLSTVTIPALDARLVTAETKLSDIEDGAQVNVIEGITLNGNTFSVDSATKIASLSVDVIDCGTSEV